MTTREPERLGVFGLRQSLRLARRTLHLYGRSIGLHVSHRANMVTIRETDLTSNAFGLRQSLWLARRTLHLYGRSILGHGLSLVVGNVNVVHMLGITGKVEVLVSTPPYTINPPPALPDNPLDPRGIRIVEEPLEYLLTHPVGYGVRAIFSPEVY